MKSEEHVRKMLERWGVQKRAAKKNGNHQKFLEACAVTRTLKIILGIKPDMKDK